MGGTAATEGGGTSEERRGTQTQGRGIARKDEVCLTNLISSMSVGILF
jgi:hypothetical protein